MCGYCFAGDYGINGRLGHISKIYDMESASVVKIETITNDGPCKGSGVLIDSLHGYILTAAHVVEDSDYFTVTFKNGHVYDCRGYIYLDKKLDLAIVKIAGNHEPSLIINRTKFEPGTDIYIVGHPMYYEWIFSRGMITGYDEDKKGNKFLYLFDSAISPGSSGAPMCVLDENGKLEIIGIVDAFIAHPYAHSLNLGVELVNLPDYSKMSEVKSFIKPPAKVVDPDKDGSPKENKFPIKH